MDMFMVHGKVTTKMEAFVKTGEINIDLNKVKPRLIHAPKNDYKYATGVINNYL
jgi:hypothetical protein